MVTFNRHRQPLSTLAARSKIIQMEHFCVRPLDRQSNSSVPMNFIKFENESGPRERENIFRIKRVFFNP